jgi:hypothetical protein
MGELAEKGLSFFGTMIAFLKDWEVIHSFMLWDLLGSDTRPEAIQAREAILAIASPDLRKRLRQHWAKRMLNARVTGAHIFEELQ